jgi:uncharacterized protein (TIGR03067 family)
MMTPLRIIPMVACVLPLACLLLAAPALGSDPPRYTDDRVEPVGLEGRWVLVGFEAEGQTASDKDLADWKRESCSAVKFALGRITIETGKGPVAGTYRVDPAARPAHLDVKEEGSAALEAIYELRGDRLRIGFELRILEMGHRPTSFRGKDVVTMIFRRVW